MARYIITGGTGFIGSNLVRKLIDSNYEVHLIVRPSSNYKYLGDLVNQLNLFIYDGEVSQLITYFKQVKPDIILHLASLFLSDHNEKNLNPLLNSNIIFGTEILEAMKQSGCKKIINTGTYWQHYNNEKYNPVCLYAATKQAFSDILYYYSQAYDLDCITLELFDTFGIGDERSKILNILKKHIGNSETIKVSPGEQLMDMVYIDDIINAYLQAIQIIMNNDEVKFETYMISSGDRRTLKELVQIVEKIISKPLVLEWGGRDYRDREILNPYSDGVILPDWQPLVSLEEGLKRFFEV